MGAASSVGLHASDEHVHPGKASEMKLKLDELYSRNLSPDEFHREMKEYFRSLHPPDWQHPEDHKDKVSVHSAHHHAHVHHGAMSHSHHGGEGTASALPLAGLTASEQRHMHNAKREHGHHAAEGDEHGHHHEHRHPVAKHESVGEGEDQLAAAAAAAAPEPAALAYDGQVEPPALEQEE